MVELGGVRYAVGTGMVKWTWVAVGTAIASYGLYLMAAALVMVQPTGEWAATVSMLLVTVALLCFAAFVVVGDTVVVSLIISEKQPVEEPPQLSERRWRRSWQQVARSELVTLLRSRVGSLAALSWSAVAIRLHWHPTGWLDFFAVVGIAFLMCMHGVALISVTRKMSSQAKLCTHGQLDLYRDFNWERMDCTDDVARFRRRYRNPRWRPPTLIGHVAEADRYANQARSWRLIWMMGAAFASLLALTFAADPLRQVITDFVDAMTNLDEPSANDQAVAPAQAITVSFWVILFATPVLIQQHHAGNLDSLAKLYDERAAELRVA